jgi:hypothetical protein
MILEQNKCFIFKIESKVPDTLTGPYCTEHQSERATTDRLRTIYKSLDSWPDTVQSMRVSRWMATASGQGSNNWEKTQSKGCATGQSLI